MVTTETIFIIFYAIIVVSVLIFGSMFMILSRKTPERKDIPYYDRFEHT